MSDVIRLLPDSVANKIAAGEVVQRPASVIKELVENSIDAGATEVHIEVKDAGKTLIRVADNGKGMSPTDARMAFERHATSKIRSADDLFTLNSMGFRGEALPSICAISEVEVRTRTADSEMGTRVVIVGATDASQSVSQEPVLCDKGTVISVKKLFFNVPARRKFLKSDSVELSNIMREFERMALVNNNVRMSIDTGTRRIDLRAGTLRQRIEDIWKNSLNGDQLLPVDVDTSLVKIEGFVSRPEFARRRNPLQYLMVNGRVMRHPYFHKAVLSSYEHLIATDTQPCYFLKFTVDPASIDVNISPTKNEVKFEFEQQIWPIISAAVKATLGKFAAVPSIDFSVDALPIQPLREGEAVRAPEIECAPGYNPFREPPARRYPPRGIGSDWEKLYEGFGSADFSPSSEERPSDDFTVRREPDTPSPGLFSGNEERGEVEPVCMQVALKYIVTSSGEDLMIIDQHRAHVKILYEDFLRKAVNSEAVSQRVMFPETITLDSSQQAALVEVDEELRGFGFVLEYESGCEWRITGMPAGAGKIDARDVVLRILDSVTEDSANYGKEAPATFSVSERMALIMARSSAVRRGDRLTVKEMESMVARLFSLPDPSLTPSGNPVFHLLTPSAIARLLTL